MADSVWPVTNDPSNFTNAPIINTFNLALAAAEGAKQSSYAAALVTFTAAGFSPAAFSAYKSAILAADLAYMTAVSNAGQAVALALNPTNPDQPVNNVSQDTAMLAQNTALSIGLLY